MRKQTVAQRAAAVQSQQNTTPPRNVIVGGIGALALIALVIVIATSTNRVIAPAVPNAVATVNTTQLPAHVPVLGNPQAAVTITEYGAYSCTTCRAYYHAGIIKSLLAKYQNQIRFVFQDFPVITPDYDNMAAATALCALDQGQDNFWKFHDALYTIADGSYSQDALLQLGKQVGLDYDLLQKCTTAKTYVATVQTELGHGWALGFRATPAFLVNDVRVEDFSADGLEAAVQKALKSS